MDISKLIKRVKDVIYPNGVKAINAQEHQALIIELLEAYNEGKANTEHKHSIDDIEDLREVVEGIESAVKNDIEDIKINNSILKKELDATKEALKIVSSGDEIIKSKGNPVLLPSNTKSSVANSYQINGMSISNFIENGDFKNGINGWESKAYELSVVNGNLVGERVNPAVVTYNHIESKTKLNVELGDRIYIKTGYSFENMTAERSFFRFLDGSESVTTDHYLGDESSYILNVTKSSSNANLQFKVWYQNGVQVGYKFIVKPTYVVNLTKAFGKGKEPSVEWCDENIDRFIVNKKSVGVNLFNPNVALTEEASGVYSRVVEDNKKCLSYQAGQSTSKENANIELDIQPGIYTIIFELKQKGDSVNTMSVMLSDGGLIQMNPKKPKSEEWTEFKEIIDTKGERIVGMKGGWYGNQTTYIDLNSVYIGADNKYTTYQESSLYLNSDEGLRSEGHISNVIKDGYLIKNVSKTGEQLDTPIATKIQTSGQLILKPNGTVFSESIKMGAEIYDGGIKTSLPIIKVESLAKFDMETGNDVEIDKSKVVISDKKLTHPDLKDGDMVFLEYFYDDNPLTPELEIESFNSNKVITDSSTGDLYSWSVEVDNGEIKLVSNKVANKIGTEE